MHACSSETPTATFVRHPKLCVLLSNCWPTDRTCSKMCMLCHLFWQIAYDLLGFGAQKACFSPLPFLACFHATGEPSFIAGEVSRRQQW
jgi:hypothetical protein